MSAWRSARLAAYMPYFAQIWPRTLCAMCEGACWPLRLSHAAIRSTLRNGVGNDNVSTLPRVAVRHLIRPQSLSLREHENSERCPTTRDQLARRQENPPTCDENSVLLLCESGSHSIYSIDIKV